MIVVTDKFWRVFWVQVNVQFQNRVPNQNQGKVSVLLSNFYLNQKSRTKSMCCKWYSCLTNHLRFNCLSIAYPSISNSLSPRNEDPQEPVFVVVLLFSQHFPIKHLQVNRIHGRNLDLFLRLSSRTVKTTQYSIENTKYLEY